MSPYYRRNTAGRASSSCSHQCLRFKQLRKAFVILIRVVMIHICVKQRKSAQCAVCTK